MHLRYLLIGLLCLVLGPDGFGQLNCEEPVTHLISEIQGTGLSSPFAENNVRVRGVVVGDFQAELGGFFLQEEADDQDEDQQTSEGIFVFQGNNPPIEVDFGDIVVVEATVREFAGLTELVDVQVAHCEQTEQPIPTLVHNWSNTPDIAERYEGMLVRFPDTFTVTGLRNLNNFGELDLSLTGRQWQFTEQFAPDRQVMAYEAEQRAQRLLLDDRRNGADRRPVFHLENNPLLRAGATTSDLIGILDYGFGHYRLRPLDAVAFTAANPLPRAQPLDTGNLRLATFNLGNYFNGNGAGGGFGGRGAQNAAEFTRQTEKVVSAILGLDAHIIGVQEVENDYFQGEQSAIDDLVDALNERAPQGHTYDYIRAGGSIGADVIAVGLIYRADRVSTVGDPAVLNTPPIVFQIDPANRAPLAQRFAVDGEQLLVVVNHFKSKAPSNYGFGDDPLDDDRGDGQSYWNHLRSRAAEALVDWVDELTAEESEPRVAILGDLNAYSEEDPLRMLEDAGYLDLLSGSYTIDFRGFWGMLDHILVSPALAGEFLTATVWHINADESDIKAYTSDDPVWLDQSATRSSDHDPLIAAFDLGSRVTSVTRLPSSAAWELLLPPASPLTGDAKWTVRSSRPVDFVLEVFDASGRQLFQRRQQGGPGETTWTILKAEFPVGGILFWRLRDEEGHQLSGKVFSP